MQRHIFVAETDAEAKRFAKPAMDAHLANINWLRNKHGVTGLTSRLNVPRGADFEECVADGTGDRRHARDGAGGDRAAGARSSASIIC